MCCCWGCCVLVLEWSALMRLSCLYWTFNTRRLHAWMEGAWVVFDLCLQSDSKVVQIAHAFVHTFVPGIQIRH